MSEPATGDKPVFHPLRAKKYVIITRVNGSYHKLFQIHFIQSDGSIYIDFPYLKGVPGLVGEFTQPAGQTTFTHDLADTAHITSQRVKYSHHPDGRAHFSQDGKVITKVKRQSVPLAELSGHFFTVNIAGPEHFAPATENEVESVSRNRTRIVFEAREAAAERITCVGHWTTLDHLANTNMALGPGDHPWWYKGTDTNGIPIIQYLLSPPLGHAYENYVMKINCQLWSVSGATAPLLLFLGGFDEEAVIISAEHDTSVLFCQYPVTNTELWTRLPSIDLTLPSPH